MKEKKFYVGFYDETVKGKIEKFVSQNHLKKAFDEVTDELKRNPTNGQQVPRNKGIKFYKSFEIDNLWRIDIIRSHPGFRLWYTIVTKENAIEIRIMSVLLNMESHKDYEKSLRN